MSSRKHSPESVARLRNSLLESAKEVVAREGAKGLTMRALAAQADCAVGLPYKVFSDRSELVSELLKEELERLVAAGARLVGRVGVDTVAENLTWYADEILRSPAVALAGEVMSDDHLARRFLHDVDQSGIGPGDFQSVFARYLAAEAELGRVVRSVDLDALGFFLAGAVHNLVVSGPAYPRPTTEQLEAYIGVVAGLVEVN
jgi:AcrR family transcriptional regulator